MTRAVHITPRDVWSATGRRTRKTLSKSAARCRVRNCTPSMPPTLPGDWRPTAPAADLQTPIAANIWRRQLLALNASQKDGDQSDYRVAQMLQAYLNRPEAAIDETRQAHLVPGLVFQFANEYPRIHLSVGFDKLYVVKSLKTFLDWVQQRRGGGLWQAPDPVPCPCSV